MTYRNYNQLEPALLVQGDFIVVNNLMNNTTYLFAIEKNLNHFDHRIYTYGYTLRKKYETPNNPNHSYKNSPKVYHDINGHDSIVELIDACGYEDFIRQVDLKTFIFPSETNRMNNEISTEKIKTQFLVIFRILEEPKKLAETSTTLFID